MPLSCAAARPRAICTAVSSAFRTGKRARSQPLAQRLALEQFRDHEHLAVMDAGVVDREDVRMRQRRDGLRFALEAGAPLGIAREARGRILIATSRLSRVSRAR